MSERPAKGEVTLEITAVEYAALKKALRGYQELIADLGVKPSRGMRALRRYFNEVDESL